MVRLIDSRTSLCVLTNPFLFVMFNVPDKLEGYILILKGYLKSSRGNVKTEMFTYSFKLIIVTCELHHIYMSGTFLQVLVDKNINRSG